MINGFVKEPIVDVIVPTFNNVNILLSMVNTFLRYTMTPYRMYIINNGDPFPGNCINSNLVEIHEIGKNLGWMGGINHGAKLGKAPYILLLNDDIQVIDHDAGWLNKLLRVCSNKDIAVAGPSSNIVMHLQNISLQGLPRQFTASIVSGFCMLTKRKVFEDLGGLDENLSGGDDIDYSMRVRKAGYKLAICRDSFIYHRGYTTGRRLYGDQWNSEDYRTKHNIELIRKHGFRPWVETACTGIIDQISGNPIDTDHEGNYLKGWVNGKCLDIGCGGKKVHPDCIGIDVIPEGEFNYTPSQCGRITEASLFYDGNKLPYGDNSIDSIVCRHVFEHFLTPWDHLKDWKRVLKVGGRAAVALPDEDLLPTVPLDPTHLHAWSKASFRSLVDFVGGFKIVESWDSPKGYSFVSVIEKL